METPENLSLYELISHIDGVEIPDIFQSELDSYILGMTDGTEIAQIMAKMLKDCSIDEINEFMGAIESHILEIMAEAFAVLDSTMVTEKKMRLFRHIMYWIYQ